MWGRFRCEDGLLLCVCFHISVRRFLEVVPPCIIATEKKFPDPTPD
jgi:hypothetical protein